MTAAKLSALIASATATPERPDNQTAKCGAHDAGDVDAYSVQREGGLELLLWHQARQHGQISRGFEGCAGFNEEDQNQQRKGRDQAAHASARAGQELAPA